MELVPSPQRVSWEGWAPVCAEAEVGVWRMSNYPSPELQSSWLLPARSEEGASLPSSLQISVLARESIPEPQAEK